MWKRCDCHQVALGASRQHLLFVHIGTVYEVIQLWFFSGCEAIHERQATILLRYSRCGGARRFAFARFATPLTPIRAMYHR
jgi:hypothetical protein